MLRIKDWNKYFENNRTREMVDMRWVPVPNRHDGDGYTDLMSRNNPLEIYGAWHLILQIASKCRPRGTLLREGGKAHNCESIARQTRAPEAGIRKAVVVLLSVGWLEEIDDPAPSCGEPAPNRLWNGMEWNGIEETEKKEPNGVAAQLSALPFFDSDFISAWELWEKHRFEKKHKLTPTTIKAQLQKCGEWGKVRSIAAINHSIEKGWLGLFEPDGDSRGHSKSTENPARVRQAAPGEYSEESKQRQRELFDAQRGQETDVQPGPDTPRDAGHI